MLHMSTRERLLVFGGAVVAATTIYKLLFATSTKVFEFRFFFGQPCGKPEKKRICVCVGGVEAARRNSLRQ